MRKLAAIILSTTLAACGAPPDAPPAPSTTSTAPTASAAEPPRATSDAHWILPAGRCAAGRHPQPGGRFVAAITCASDGAATLAVVYEGGDHPRFQAAWPATARTWAEQPWTADVTSLAWAPDGTRLFVATSDVRGAGGLFELDLAARRLRQLMPFGPQVTIDDPGPGFVVLGIDAAQQTIHYQVAPWTPEDAGVTMSIAPR